MRSLAGCLNWCGFLQEVLEHVATRLTWESPGFQMHIFTDAQLLQPQAVKRLQELASKAVILLSIQIQQDSAVQVSSCVK